MQLYQNFRISGGFEHPKPPLRYATIESQGIDQKTKCEIAYYKKMVSRSNTQEFGKYHQQKQL
jgi:hypothetical protein